MRYRDRCCPIDCAPFCRLPPSPNPIPPLPAIFFRGDAPLASPATPNHGPRLLDFRQPTLPRLSCRSLCPAPWLRSWPSLQARSLACGWPLLVMSCDDVMCMSALQKHIPGFHDWSGLSFRLPQLTRRHSRHLRPAITQVFSC
ncbi:hypothetical protein BJX62DRAFT_84675 [Aspergillus germanicus]